MENLENDVKKAQLLSDEELKNVSGGIDYDAPMTMLHIQVCDSIGPKEECEQHDFCTWQLYPGSWSRGYCKYNGAK